MASPTEIEKKSNSQKNNENIKQDIRPEKYSDQRKQERDRTQDRDNNHNQKREETDYDPTQVKGLI